MVMPGTSLVAMEQAAEHIAFRVRPRTSKFVLFGLAVSGWIGFLVLAGVLVTGRPASVPERQDAKIEVQQPIVNLRDEAEVEVRQPKAKLSEHAPDLQPVSILTTFEERRRIQERVREWDVADHQEGNVAAARQVYEYAMRKGWAPAALALAFAHDPHELQRRGVNILGDAAKARACYIKARELMNAMVAYYLSRLPPGAAEWC
jgi:hypothetical protein